MIKLSWLPLAAFLFSLCSGQNFPHDPRLVIFISVDQFSGELFQRIESEFNGGFKWLLDHGIDFRNTHHEHATTVTGVGHFVLGSGRHPGPIGVLGNSWYVRELGKSVNCVEDSIAKPIGGNGDARSYRQTDADAIGDWIKQADHKSKVFTVAGKDRAAVFLGGKNADLAIYYNWEGSFITSDYYADDLPDWLKEFNTNLNFVAYRDSVWTHVANPEFYKKYGTIDDFYGEVDTFDDEPYSPTLPITLKSKPLEETNKYIGATPWFDKTVLELAGLLTNKENLGKDRHVDLLCVGISMSDWIGHDHGPHSHEVLDYFLRLDQYLMKFIRQIDSEVGLENVIFVLSSDHGVMPLPEFLSDNGVESGRLDINEFNLRLNRIKEKAGDDIVYQGEGFYFPENYSNEEKQFAKATIREELKNIIALSHIFTREEILEMKGNDPLSRRFRNMIHPFKSPDVILLIKENFIYRNPFGTSHGTPYNYDTHVPLIFSHINTKPVKISRPVATVDIAPTIGWLLNVSIPEDVDGISLMEIVQ